MILGYHAIERAFNTVWDYHGKGDPHIGPNSIDVSLSDRFIRYTKDRVASKYIYPTLILKPGDFLLGCTEQRFRTTVPFEGQKYVQMYEGRSSLGRLGVGTHVTAGFGDYGFEGRFTLEIFNLSNMTVEINAGERVGQVYFQQVMEPKLYNGSYNSEEHNLGPVESKL